MNATRKTKRTSRQLFRLCLVDGALDEPRVRQVARSLAASGRRGALAILTGFRRLVRLHRDRRTAVVESASPLPVRLRDDVAARLARIYGPGLATSFAEEPRLLGGLRVKVGSDVYDTSVRARLAALEARL